jgi:hypothetical protein
MAVSTKDQANLGFLNIFGSAIWESINRPPRGGIFPWRHKYSLATTEIDNADDSIRLLQVPDGMCLIDGTVHFEDDADTNVSPALVWDLITEDLDGNDDTLKLITAATAGQSAGEAVAFDTAARGVIYSAARYITMDVTTAAGTAAAADFWLTLLLSYGVGTFNVPALKFEAV